MKEIRKEELLSDNPCYQIQMLNKTKNGEKDKNILKCKNFAQSFKNTKIMDIGEIGFSEGIYFIIGENGVGKSTFIKKMAKLLKGKGKSFYCGNEIKRSYEYISMVMQDVNYQIFTESVWSEISIVSQDDAKKERVLKELMLYDKKDSHPQSLSGGEKQRVAICRALINDPDLVLADEPTGNLDSKSGKIVIDALNRINREFGKTIVMVTHDPQMASNCRKIILLKDGVILETHGTGRKSQEEFYQEIIGKMEEL